VKISDFKVSKGKSEFDKCKPLKIEIRSACPNIKSKLHSFESWKRGKNWSIWEDYVFDPELEYKKELWFKKDQVVVKI